MIILLNKLIPLAMALCVIGALTLLSLSVTWLVIRFSGARLLRAYAGRPGGNDECGLRDDCAVQTHGHDPQQPKAGVTAEIFRWHKQQPGNGGAA